MGWGSKQMHRWVVQKRDQDRSAKPVVCSQDSNSGAEVNTFPAKIWGALKMLGDGS